MKDNFSRQADVYAKYRPSYPKELFDFLFSHIPIREAAWDCATGNGQTARELARHFSKVCATDISQKQIDNAYQAENIFYTIQAAEKTDFPDKYFDLITVSQALHWFDFDKFYAEAKRVGKVDAILSVWTYSLLRISPAIDKIIEDYHFGTLKDFWDKERSYVDNNYSTIPFPFEEIKTPPFFITYQWSLEDLEGYFNTWSALQKFITSKDYSPVPDLIKRISPHWSSEKMKIIFPLHMRMGKLR